MDNVDLSWESQTDMHPTNSSQISRTDIDNLTARFMANPSFHELEAMAVQFWSEIKYDLNLKVCKR